MYTLEITKKRNKNSIALAVSSDEKIDHYISLKEREDEKDPIVKSIKVKTGLNLRYFPLLPVKDNQRNATYISAMSGSGKSFLCAALIEQFIEDKRFQDLPIYLITTAKDPDPAFENLPIKKMDIYSPDFMLLTNESFRDSICIFDDWESCQDRDIEKHIHTLVNVILQNNRKLNTHIFILSHLITNFSKTRLILLEVNNVCLFPNSDRNSIQKYLKNYIGLSKDKIAELINTPSRYFFLNKNFPLYVISRKKIELL
jgi:hypothetical protein